MNRKRDLSKKNDSLLLLMVAGLVVAGAAAIVLLSSLSAHRGSSEDTPLANVSSQATIPEPAVYATAEGDVPAAPAVFGVDRPTAAELVLPESRAETNGPDSVAVDPDADWLVVAREAYAKREFAVAAAYFGAQAEQSSGRAWPHYMHGLSLWKAGRADDAADAMRRSIEIDGEWIKARINLARIENDRGDYVAALDAAEAAVAIDSEDPEALFLQGRSLRNLGRVDEAVAVLDASLALAPDNGYVRNLLGLIHVQLNQDSEAVDQLLRAAELEPEVAFIQNNLGMALEIHGRPAEALAAYRRAMELDPAHEKATTNLARLEPLVPPVDAPDEETTEVAEEGSDATESEAPEGARTADVAEALEP
jgi:tetratricopeptide (TPR) repeat protein